MKRITILLTSIFFCLTLNARIINIPKDYAKIQQGIDVASYGDTILVQPGTYFENIDFKGKAVTVGSLYINTHNEGYISSTIIDGSRNGSVVCFKSGETNQSILIGFTLQNGSGYYSENYYDGFGLYGNWGGGIFCEQSNPQLQSLIITNNSVTRDGGGIFCNQSSPIINKVSMVYNLAWLGGGFMAVGGNPIISNSSISYNSSSYEAGGIRLNGCPNVSLTNVIIYWNYSVRQGGLSFYGGNAILNNVLIAKNSSIEGAHGFDIGMSGSAVCNHVTIANNIPEGDREPKVMNIRISGGRLKLTNSIVSGIRSGHITLEPAASGTLDISFSNIEGSNDGIIRQDNDNIIWGQGNIDADPAFINPSGNDFHLGNSSLCIGSGSSSISPEFDLENKIRPNPAGSNPDMGAYENALGTPNILPTVTTLSVTNITETAATCGGEVTDDAGDPVTFRGVCWNISGSPTIESSKTIDGNGKGTFTSNLAGLSGSTTYHMRAYATNSKGTSYGNEVIFSTSESTGGTFIDQRDDHKYKWVKIGSQIWMGENLAWLPAVSALNIGSKTDPYYYVEYYNTDLTLEIARNTNYFKTNGVLYNFPAAKSGCPNGWILPSDDEWIELETFLGMDIADTRNSGIRESGTVGKKLKSTTLWGQHGGDGTTKFDANPAGNRAVNGFFNGGGQLAAFWSSTESGGDGATHRYLYQSDGIARYDTEKAYGFSVRCIKKTYEDLATVNTTSISFVTSTTAECGGQVVSEGTSAVSARGVCWSTNANPTINDNKTIDGKGKGSFESSITGLKSRTQYFVRAYATNSSGTAYGNEKTFFTNLIDKPDLIITEPKANPKSIVPNGRFSLGCNYYNQGIKSEEPSFLKAYLSSNQTLDANDYLLFDALMLQPDYVQYYEVFYLELPKGIANGVWYILFVADAENNVAESIETNNISSVEILIGSTSIIDTPIDNGISIYPNPNDGKFRISAQSNFTHLEILNLLGERVYFINNSEGKSSIDIDLSLYGKGIYLLKMFDGGRFMTGKIIIE